MASEGKSAMSGQLTSGAAAAAAPARAPALPSAAAAANPSSSPVAASHKRARSPTDIDEDDEINPFEAPIPLHALPSSNLGVSRWVRDKIIELRTMIANAQQQFNEHKVAVDSRATLSMLDDLLERLDKEYVVALLGRNGLGKSYLFNMLLFLTLQRDDYGKQLPAPHRLEADCIAEELQRDSPNVRVKRIEMSADELTLRVSADRLRTETLAFEQQVRDYWRQPFNSELRGYLLPSQRGSGCTTKCLLQIKYGATLHVMVQYLGEDTAKERAFGLVEALRELETESADSQLGKNALGRLEVAEQHYHKLTGVNPRLQLKLPSDMNSSTVKQWRREQERAQSKKAEKKKKHKGAGAAAAASSSSSSSARAPSSLDMHDFPDSASSIALDEDIRKVLNSCLIVSGRGVHAEADRAFLRDKIEFLLHGRRWVDGREQIDETAARRACAVASITLFIPATVVAGRAVWQDMPGTGDIDPVAIEITETGINEADVVVTLTERSLATDKMSADALTSSNFLRTAIADPRAYGQVISLACSEKDYRHAVNHLSDLSKEEETQRKTAQSSKQLLHDKLTDLYDSQVDSGALRNDDVVKLVERTLRNKVTQFDIRPTLFTSLMLTPHQQLVTADHKQVIDEQQRRDLLHATHIYSLLGALRSFDSAHALYVLKRLLGAARSQPETTDENPDAPMEEEQKGDENSAASASAGAAADAAESSESESDESDSDSDTDSSDVDSDDSCSDDSSDDEDAGAAAAPSPSFTSASPKPGRRPRKPLESPLHDLVRELQMQQVEQQEGDAAVVGAMEKLRELAEDMLPSSGPQRRRRNNQRQLHDNFEREAEKLCSNLNRAMEEAVTNWFVQVDAKRTDDAINAGQAALKSRIQTLQIKNKKSILDPVKRGKSPLLNLRNPMMCFDVSHPLPIHKLRKRLRRLLLASKADFSDLLRRWICAKFAAVPNLASNREFAEKLQNICGQQESTLSVQIDQLVAPFLSHIKAAQSLDPSKLNREFSNAESRAMGSYLTNKSRIFTSNNIQSIHSELLDNGVRALYIGTRDLQRDSTLKRVKLLNKWLLAKLVHDSSSVLNQCVDKFVRHAASYASVHSVDSAVPELVDSTLEAIRDWLEHTNEEWIMERRHSTRHRDTVGREMVSAFDAETKAAASAAAAQQQRYQHVYRVTRSLDGGMPVRMMVQLSWKEGKHGSASRARRRDNRVLTVHADDILIRSCKREVLRFRPMPVDRDEGIVKLNSALFPSQLQVVTCHGVGFPSLWSALATALVSRGGLRTTIRSLAQQQAIEADAQQLHTVLEQVVTPLSAAAAAKADAAAAAAPPSASLRRAVSHPVFPVVEMHLASFAREFGVNIWLWTASCLEPLIIRGDMNVSPACDSRRQIHLGALFAHPDGSVDMCSLTRAFNEPPPTSGNFAFAASARKRN